MDAVNHLPLFNIDCRLWPARILSEADAPHVEWALNTSVFIPPCFIDFNSHLDAVLAAMALCGFLVDMNSSGVCPCLKLCVLSMYSRHVVTGHMFLLSCDSAYIFIGRMGPDRCCFGNLSLSKLRSVRNSAL